jgi:hypothetical protein
MNRAPWPTVIEDRLSQAASLPDVLNASFDAFMMTADAAVDGREALTIAPSLPSTAAPSQPAPCLLTPTPTRLPTPWPGSRRRFMTGSPRPTRRPARPRGAIEH